jgi:hypothetical protein
MAAVGEIRKELGVLGGSAAEVLVGDEAGRTRSKNADSAMGPAVERRL